MCSTSLNSFMFASSYLISLSVMNSSAIRLIVSCFFSIADGYQPKQCTFCIVPICLPCSSLFIDLPVYVLFTLLILRSLLFALARPLLSENSLPARCFYLLILFFYHFTHTTHLIPLSCLVFASPSSSILYTIYTPRSGLKLPTSLTRLSLFPTIK